MEISYDWESYGITDPGNKRTVNEDAFMENVKERIWVVADGMGGHERGDKASQAITQALLNVEGQQELPSHIDVVEDALIATNTDLLRYSSEELGGKTVGSTVAGMTAFEDRCIVFWMGDSRVYRFRRGELSRLTQDHTEVEELFEAGEITEDEMESHPDKNVITRAVGVEDDLFLDLEHSKIFPDDLFLLCSDGLDKEVREQQIGEILSRDASLEELGQALIATALENGGKDNVTVVLVRAGNPSS